VPVCGYDLHAGQVTGAQVPPGTTAEIGCGCRCRRDATPALQLLRMARGRVSSHLAMSVFDQPVERLQPHEPIPPVWRMFCRCSFKVGRWGDIAACECRSWWRVGKRSRWYPISKRGAFRALLPELMRELNYFEVTGDWPGN